MTNQDIASIWIYLAASPLTGLTITLLAYGAAVRVYEYFDLSPVVHPVVVSIGIIILFLALTGTSYEDYFKGAQYVHFLLGPATVALAIPLYQQRRTIRKLWMPILITLIGGVLIACCSAIIIAQIMQGSTDIQLSLAPKSVTAPVAMALSKQLNGIPSLTAVMVIITGVLGAIFGTKILSVIGITDDASKGMAMGITAHGIGTARAFQVSKEMGAFSGLAMATSCLITALILPWLVDVFIAHPQ